MNRLRGFTLVEMIMVIVITGIVAGMVAVFIATPVKGYVDTVRRAGLTDMADLALKRMALELRTAVPNSIRTDSTEKYLELIPSRIGGRYCADSDSSSGCTPLTTTTTNFDVLTAPHDANSPEFVVVFNMPDESQPDLSAYRGNNIRAISSTGTSTTVIAFSGIAFPFDPDKSPSKRFHVVPATGPVTFGCTAAGELRRYSSYRTNITQFTPANNQPTSGLGTGSLLTSKVSACSFKYDSTNALVTLELTLTDNGESVTLLHQIHVDNTS